MATTVTVRETRCTTGTPDTKRTSCRISALRSALLRPIVGSSVAFCRRQEAHSRLVSARSTRQGRGRDGELFAFASRVRPLVSFVIPVKNDAQRLGRCLSSILANDYPRELIEIIVIDNDSTDGSAGVAREHGAIVLSCASRSVAELRNRGARAALGSVIAFVDADHEIEPLWIGTAVGILSDPAIAATGAAYLAEPCANWVQLQYDRLRDRPATRQDVNWLGSGNLAVKRLPFESVGGFNGQLTACEDVDLCNRLLGAGHRIVADPGLRSVHFGDPRTLKALFLGELWRGRDNLRVTFSGPRTLRHFRSALVPVTVLALLAGGLLALLIGYPGLALGCWLLAVAPAALKASYMLRWRWGHADGMARPERDVVVAGRRAVEALAVAVVFDMARALALLARGSHRARRSA